MILNCMFYNRYKTAFTLDTISIIPKVLPKQSSAPASRQCMTSDSKDVLDIMIIGIFPAALDCRIRFMNSNTLVPGNPADIKTKSGNSFCSAFQKESAHSNPVAVSPTDCKAYISKFLRCASWSTHQIKYLPPSILYKFILNNDCKMRKSADVKSVYMFIHVCKMLLTFQKTTY